MSSYAKYDFAPIGEAPAAPGRAGGPQRRALGEEDLARARQEGFAEGQRDATAQAERASADALRAIARMMQITLGRLAEEAQTLRADAVEVALVAARAAAGRTLDLWGSEAVEDYVREAVSHLRATPRLVVKVSPDLAADLQARLEAVAAEAGFEGLVAVRPDPSARPGDCGIEWADGAIHHDRDAAFAAIEEAAERWLASAEAHGFQLDLFSA